MPEQTDRDLLVSIRDQINAHLEEPEPPVDPDAIVPADSPTGRNPKLVWTRHQQGVYNKMLAERDAGAQTLGAIWCDLIIDNAKGNVYGDSGLWATIAYQMTGDLVYVGRAWDKIQAMLASELDDDNNTREYSAERVLMLDWLWPGLSEDQRAQMFTAIDRMFTNVSDIAVRTNDSDQCTGTYMGAAFYFCAFGDVHQPAQDFFNLPGVGGLDPTGRDRSTMRNSIYDYVLMAEGGEWIESQHYNTGTTRLLMFGAAGILTATNDDHFPEVTEWMAEGALKYSLMMTPDLAEVFAWGDEEAPHQFHVEKWISTAMVFDDPVARHVVYALADTYGPIGYQTAEPTVARAFTLFNPYGPIAPTNVRVLDGRGQGIVSARSTHGSMLCTHLVPTFWVAPVDHAVAYFGDIQFYRGTSWALTHPLTYGGIGIDGRGCNVMLHRGVGMPKEWRGSLAVYAGEDWIFHAGTSGGTILPSKFYQPPATWLHEYSRSILCIFGAEVDTLIIFDRTHCDDPLLLPGVEKYDDNTQKKMNEHALRLWRWHCPVEPVIAGNTATWPIGDGGQQCRVTWLRDDLEVQITDQGAEWPTPPYSMDETEKKFHLDVVPPDAVGFQTLITVMEFGTHFASILPVVLDEDVLAVTLTADDHPDWAVIFNTRPGPALPTYGGDSAYHPDIPAMLSPVRFREYPLTQTGGRVWGMETATGLPVG